jgi:hypothetical protein
MRTKVLADLTLTPPLALARAREKIYVRVFKLTIQ